ncbi:hypothetical protein BD410DRAFT_85088 [Rickenella mellea]|uniref:F-box domain-containing protein n=1 Tax=Rickenella mellea TaxID=50990 RepID=A0A4Y7PLE7_9AGAM|nr:hypothetical protein BD410DRAFT_85088 [Rickenella mellea]
MRNTLCSQGRLFINRLWSSGECRLWREISLTTPHLWCSIQVGDMKAKGDGYSSLPYHRNLRRDSVTLRKWLRRSGNCPLSIGICYDACHDSELDVIKKTIEVAIVYIRRWKHFTLHLPRTLFSWNVLFPILAMASPVLESLHILSENTFSEEWDEDPRHFKPHHIMGDSASMIPTGHHNLLLESEPMTLEAFKLCISHCLLLERILVIGILSTPRHSLTRHTRSHI